MRAYDNGDYNDPIPRRGKNSTPTGTRAQTSKTVGIPIQIVYGTTAVMGVPLLWVNQGTGAVALDGVNVGDVTVANAVYGFAFGPVAAVEGVLYQKLLYSSGTPISGTQLADYYLVMSGAGVTYTLGDPATTTIWSLYSGSADWNQKIPYGYIASLRAVTLGCPTGKPEEMKGVIRGFFASHRNTEREAVLSNRWQIYDASPADIVTDIIENAVYGLGFPTGTVDVDTGSDGTASSSYRRWCQAMRLYIAVGIDDNVEVQDVIAQILTATNAVGYWDGPTFRVVPLGEEVAYNDGFTYTPVLTALRITDDELELQDENPVKMTRDTWVKTYNIVPVEWTQDTPFRDVELIVSEDMDTASVSIHGMMRGDTVSLPCIRTQSHALYISRVLAARSTYNRNTWEIRVSPRTAARVRVGDMIAVTHAAMNLVDQLVRVTETEEDVDGTLTVYGTTWATHAVYTLASLIMATPVYDLVAYAHDPVGGGEEYGRWVAAHTLYFLDNFGPTRVSAGIAATASTVLSVKKNGTEMGTLTFAAAGTVPTMSCTAWQAAAGDIITVVNATTADATLANLSITLSAVRDP